MIPSNDAWITSIAILVGLYGIGTFASAKYVPTAYILVPIMQGLFLSSIFAFYFDSEIAKLMILGSIMFSIPSIAYMAYQTDRETRTKKDAHVQRIIDL